MNPSPVYFINTQKHKQMTKELRQAMIEKVNAIIEENEFIAEDVIVDGIIDLLEETEALDRLGRNRTALDLIAAEREKQIRKGYTVEHDQKYVERTGISYSLLADRLLYNGDLPDDWNMDYWIKLRNLPNNRKLAIAGAWIAAELDRIIHLENKEQ